MKCLFCDNEGRKDNLRRHIRAKHNPDDPSVVATECVGACRLARGSASYNIWCFACKDFVKCERSDLMAAKVIAKNHRCDPEPVAAAAPAAIPNITVTDISGAVVTVTLPPAQPAPPSDLCGMSFEVIESLINKLRVAAPEVFDLPEDTGPEYIPARMVNHIRSLKQKAAETEAELIPIEQENGHLKADVLRWQQAYQSLERRNNELAEENVKLRSAYEAWRKLKSGC